jgi:hypothetical protein
MGHRQGRQYRPKRKVTCLQCGWRGTRSVIAKKCPRCGCWHPLPDDNRRGTFEIIPGLDYEKFKVLNE